MKDVTSEGLGPAKTIKLLKNYKKIQLDNAEEKRTKYIPEHTWGREAETKHQNIQGCSS